MRPRYFVRIYFEQRKKYACKQTLNLIEIYYILRKCVTEADSCEWNKYV